MATLGNVYIKLDTLKKLVEVLESKKENGISIDISINNETNQYGQNLTSYVSQSKEDRDNKKPRYYVGNGKVFWTDGSIKVADKVESNTPTESNNNTSQEEEDPFPF